MSEMKEHYRKPIEGVFKVEQLDKDGNVIDVYESSNKIMRDSKLSMAEVMSGTLAGAGDPLFINLLVLGTEGHNENLLFPKDIDYARKDLFAKELNKPTYPIRWDTHGNLEDEGYDPNLPGPHTESSTIRIYRESSLDNETIVFEVLIPKENGNNAGGPVAYTEAALYTSYYQNNDPNNLHYGTIFAMRTFPAKIKDSATELKITWRIIF